MVIFHIFLYVYQAGILIRNLLEVPEKHRGDFDITLMGSGLGKLELLEISGKTHSFALEQPMWMIPEIIFLQGLGVTKPS